MSFHYGVKAGECALAELQAERNHLAGVTNPDHYARVWRSWPVSARIEMTRIHRMCCGRILPGYPMYASDARVVSATGVLLRIMKAHKRHYADLDIKQAAVSMLHTMPYAKRRRVLTAAQFFTRRPIDDPWPTKLQGANILHELHLWDGGLATQCQCTETWINMNPFDQIQTLGWYGAATFAVPEEFEEIDQLF